MPRHDWVRKYDVLMRFRLSKEIAGDVKGAWRRDNRFAGSFSFSVDFRCFIPRSIVASTAVIFPSTFAVLFCGSDRIDRIAQQKLLPNVYDDPLVRRIVERNNYLWFVDIDF